MMHRTTLPTRLLSPKRSNRRGTVIVIVLGLLVILALVGIAFQYLVMNDYRAAKNWQTRYRADSVAQDGFSVAIARLRVTPTRQHWEGEGEWSYLSRREKDVTNNTYYRLSPQGDGRTKFEPSGVDGVDSIEREFFGQYYFPNTTLGKGDENNLVSYSVKSANGTNSDGTEDSNWVDRNGDGIKDTSEEQLGRDLRNQGGDPLRQISYFAGDGIDLQMRAPAVRSGTFRELGDRARLKIIDTNSQLNINDYNGAQLAYMLKVLGAEIASLLDSSGDNIPSGTEVNLFPDNVVQSIVNLKESRLSRRIEDKDEIERIMRELIPNGFNEDVFDFTMDFITLVSWPLVGSGQGQILRYDIARNPRIEEPMFTSPHYDKWKEDNPTEEPTDVSERRTYFPLKNGKFDGSSTETIDSVDGLGGLLPQVSRVSRSPFNVNTVTLPVLTALIAGIEAEAKFIVLPKKGLQEGQIFHKDAFTQYLTASHTPTDLTKQPYVDQSDLTNSAHLHSVFDLDNHQNQIGNLAPYQEIVIGPMGYQPVTNTGDFQPQWKDTSGGDLAAVRNPVNEDGSEARSLARLILLERDKNGPFLSWMDFDYRICHQILADFQALEGQGGEGDVNSPANFPDLINAKRNGWDSESITADIPSVGKYLPNPESLIGSHPAARVEEATDSFTYSTGGFKAWYLRSAIDMLRANFNPNGFYNKKNPDHAMYTTVDVTDLRYQTAPICFSTMGVYEVTSQGEVAALRPDARSGELRDHAVARRTYRGIVETYRTLEHTTQQDFLSNFVSESGEPALMLNAKGTMTHPNSIDTSAFDYEKEIHKDHYRRRGLPYANKQDEQNPGDPITQRRFNLDGYYSIGAADNERGYVTLHPQDRTPVNFMMLGEGGLQKGRLNFYAPFNTSFEARARLANDPPITPAGANPPIIPSGLTENASVSEQGSVGISLNATNEGRGNIHPFGHLPVSRSGRNIRMAMWHGDLEQARRDTAMRYLWAVTTTATPDPLAQDFITDPDDQWGGFENMADRTNRFAARYANLRPDGVLLRGWDLSPAFWPKDEKSLDGAHVSRMAQNPNAAITGGKDYAAGPWAKSRLAILRYRCGGISDETPFSPIAGIQPQQSDVQHISPSDPLSEAGLKNIVRRGYGDEQLWGGGQAGRGIDAHNIAYQDSRQFDTNFPYYQGWVDFWIKWELPPQGGSQDVNVGGVTIAAGDLDPGSANFSGLLGATQFGRFSESVTDGNGDGVIWRDLRNNSEDLDFEGSSFFLFKEAGGYLRVSQSYFTWAHTADIPESVGSGGSSKSTILVNASTPFATIETGNDYRITGKPTTVDPDSADDFLIDGQYIYTNDIASGVNGDLGFAFARIESRVNLSSLVQAAPEDRLVLAPHSWYRFTMNYRSNVESGNAHTIYIDGKKLPVQTLQKGSWNTLSVTGTGRNTGEVVDSAGTPTAFSEDAFETSYYVQRSSSKSIEVDPEDRLTVGCIFRRQHGGSIDEALNNADMSKSPLFYLDRNLVAVANATIDDLRISAQEPGILPEDLYTSAEYASFSRYHKLTDPRDEPFGGDGTEFAGGGWEELGRYENGFVATQPAVEIKDASGKIFNYEAPYALPVQVGSLTWTEYRPWWDSYRGVRVDLRESEWAKAPHVTLNYRVYESISDAYNSAGNKIDTRYLQKMNSTNREARNYWLAGGYALSKAEGRAVYLDNGGGSSSTEASGVKAFFKYQAHFLVDTDSNTADSAWGVLNSTPVLDDVRITILTPARVLSFEIVDD